MLSPLSGTPKHALLLTGPPGVGKTTIIRHVASFLAGRRLRGFTTEEIREGGQRLGFRLETFEGASVVLAHVDLPSRHRVGRYGVDVDALERVVGSALAPDEATAAYLIDEIGKMECLSGRFVAAAAALLDSRRPVVATIAARGSGFIEDVKRRADVEVWAVTRANRDGLPPQVLAWLEEAARRLTGRSRKG